MDKNVFIEKIAEFKRIQAEHKKMMSENAKNIFSDISKGIFEKNPSLNSFAWSQYTPYFNDGESCTFSVNRDYYKINGSEETCDDWSLNHEKYSQEMDLTDYGFETLDQLRAAYTDINELIDMFDDDDLEGMFGDHVEIVVFRDGRIEIDYYSHD
jgi:hypothetical protein